MWYQFNINDWQLATGTTNWAAGLILTTRSNVFKAYAMDIAGGYSPTSSVSFLYIMSDRLTVNTNSLGNISPSYNGKLLEIGADYQMTAKADKGFRFVNWTDGLGNVLTNKTTLHFIMASNLTFVANFVEMATPTLTIKTPKANQTVTNALLKVTGTANDIWGVSNVWYQLNNGTWNLATTTNGWKNWTATLPLVAGTNRISALSVNAGGNLSPIESVSTRSSDTFKLELGFASAPSLVSNGFSFNLQLSPGLNGTIEVSTDLVNWATLTNFVGTNSIINFRDSSATNYSQRFYRAITSMP